MPVSTGKIFTNNGITYIDVKAKLLPFIRAFIFVWLGVLGVISIADIITDISQHSNQLPLFPLAMILFGYLLMIGGFKFESKAPKKFLIELLEAKEINQ